MATKKKAAKKKTQTKAKTATKSPAKAGKKKSAKKAATKATKKSVTAGKALKAIRGLIAVPSETLATGSLAPAFSLMNDEGHTVSLTHFSGKKVVLYFYPKDDTPGCTKESCDFRDSFSRVQSAGAVVLGVSKDSVKSHQRFKAKFSLPFPLLSDESGKMLEAYGVWKPKSMYGKDFMGIERTTYLIDVDMNGKGTIRKSYPKVKVEGHVDEILKDLSAKA